MSARRWQVRLSPDAERDYDDILLDSLLTWGESQMLRYQAAPDHALAEIEDYPEIGSMRNEYLPGCRIRPVERHVLFYRIGDDVEVIRILHERADPARHLKS
jgi:toxin ParE1/3/4